MNALTLCKANAELQLDIARLLMENAQRCFDGGQHTAAQGIAEATAAIETLQSSEDWASLARLPAGALLQAVQQRLAGGQAIGELIVQNQAAFATGLQQAVVHWQHAVTRVGAEQQAPVAMPEWLKPWTAPWAAFLSAAAARKA